MHKQTAHTGMAEWNTIIQHIERNVKQLIDENAALRKQLAEQEQEKNQQIEALREQLNNNTEHRKEEPTNTINQRDLPTQQKESTEIALKIDQIICSIDRSLALLSQRDG